MTVDLSKRLVGAVGALALTGGALGAVAPAHAASAALTYACTGTVPGTSGTYTMVADTDAPRRIAYGETVTPTATGTVTVPEAVTTAIRDTIGAKKVDGRADVAATVDGTANPWTLTVPMTNVPPHGTMTLVGTGPAGTFTGEKVGRIFDIAVGNFTATVNFYEANGTPRIPPSTTVTCVLNPSQSGAVDTIKVVKDKTTTTVMPRQTRLGAKVKAKIKVVAEHGETVKGRVKAKLFRNGNRIQTKQVYLRDGKRKVTFIRAQRPGNYKVVGKYVGHQNFRGSRGKVTFRIG
jgi:uncharacterized protein DUF6801